MLPSHFTINKDVRNVKGIPSPYLVDLARDLADENGVVATEELRAKFYRAGIWYWEGGKKVPYTDKSLDDYMRQHFDPKPKFSPAKAPVKKEDQL